ILKAATDFFGQTTEGLAKVIEKAFKEQGRPNAYIKGEEAGAAITVGLRYGDGELITKAGGSARVYWAGPSIGFDLGANAAKVF
ncbi:EipA family protein, partial [Acinetobacter baumannii]